MRGIAPPRAVGTLPALVLVAGAEPHPVRVAGAFTGAERYEARSSAPGVAAAALTGTAEVSVSPLTEGEASVRVTASNRAGSAELSFGVTVIADPAEAAVVAETLSAMGRGLLSSASEVIARRMEARGGDSRVTMAALSGANGGLPQGGIENAALGIHDLFRGGRLVEEVASFEGFNPVRDSFALSFGQPDEDDPSSGTGGGVRWGLWGAGDLVSFQGAPAEGAAYSGDLRTPYVGADVGGESWLAGLAISRSVGRAEYSFSGAAAGEGEATARITSFLPYAFFRPSERTEVWAVGGAGGGSLKTDRGDRGRESRGLSLRMGLVGGRLRVAGSGQGLDVALRGDAGLARLGAASGAGVTGGLRSRALRLRMGAETRYRRSVRGSGSFEPYASVAVRADSDSGSSGRGLEIGGGARLTAGTRFRLEAQGRMLAAYSEDGFRERGAGLTALLQPKQSGEGLSFSLAPTWGGRGGQDALWRPDADLLDSGRRAGRNPEGGAFEARFGFGFPAGFLPGVFTPFTDYGAGDGRNRFRFGVRYGDPLSPGRMFDLELSGERSAYGETPASFRLNLRGNLRF